MENKMRTQNRCYDCEYCKYHIDYETFYCTQSKLRNKFRWLLGLKFVNEEKLACNKALIKTNQR